MMVSDEPELCVLGSCIFDLTLVLDALPEEGGTIFARQMYQGLGGKGLNQAVGCARLGVRTSLLSSVGSDSYGNSFIEFLHRSDVRCDAVVQRTSGLTGVGIPMVTLSGGKSIIVAPNCALTYLESEVKFALSAMPNIRCALMQLETSPEALEAVVQEMHRRSGLVVLNAAPPLPDREHVFAKCDVIVANRGEAQWLAEATISDPETALSVAKRLRQIYGVKALIVTLGSSGAVCALEDDGFSVLPADANVVDRTGAGDAFCSALTCALLRGAQFREACEIASNYAAMACERVGSAQVLPTLAEFSSRFPRTTAIFD